MDADITTGTAAGPDTARFKERVRREWSDAATVAAWRKWQPKFAAMSGALTEALIAAARLAPGQRVLDLACGAGEPALTIAGLVGPAGHVTATDLSPGMVAATEAFARERGLANVTCRQADAEDLPFPDASFDAATSRLGVMFFPDAPRAQREIRRVLRPGGRVAFVAWGPPAAQGFFASTVGVCLKYAQVPPPEPGAPTPFTYARPGSLAAVMREAGFRQVEEEQHAVDYPWPGPPEEFLQHAREVAAPLRAILGALPPERRAEAEAEMLATLGRYADGGRLHFPAAIVVASGVR
jgi:ubiquinone/menaquinone biosynthesis C-methylase UbiE